MSNFMRIGSDYKLLIPRWKEVDKVTFYEIQVNIGSVTWTVRRRYSEFDTLHKALVNDHGVQADILPPKKVLNRRDNEFIEARRQGLQDYLVEVVRFLQKTMPKKLVVFLKMQHFDVTFIARNLAVNFYQCGEMILTKVKNHTMSVLELYAINEQLKEPCSSVLLDQREDLSHILDFCYQLKELTVAGSENCIEDSNITPNHLSINFSVFKSLECLVLSNCKIGNINDLGALRLTLNRIFVKGGLLGSLVDILLCDKVHKTSFDQQNEWALTQMTITDTEVDKIDQSLTLVPNLKALTLNNNKISEISNLNSLQKLAVLSITHNVLRMNSVIDANRIVNLDLSENLISTLKPFSALVSLETLNLLFNKITDVTEVNHICALEFLETLVLTGNPVSQIVDYRIKVLEYFGDRAYRVCLDLETTGQTELDKVAIMSALHGQRKQIRSQ